jgi:hypothetical protein
LLELQGKADWASNAKRAALDEELNTKLASVEANFTSSVDFLLTSYD